MATKDPVKYEGMQHLPFAPGDTLPPGIAPVVTDGTIGGDGTNGNPLTIDPGSIPAGPAGVPGPAGPSGLAGVADTPTVDLTLAAGILSGVIRLSPDANNCLELRANGLYIACPTGGAPATATSVGISTTTPNVTEGDQAQFRLTLDIANTAPIDVNISYSGTEFDANPAAYPAAVVQIPAGVLIHTFNRVTYEDLTDEPNRVLTASITGSTPALTISVSAVSVNVLDDEEASTLVQPPTFDQNFACHVRASSHDAAAGAALRIKPDGTWTVSWGAAFNIGHASGSWHVGTPANPGLFEARIVGTIDGTSNEYGGMDCAGFTDYTLPFDTGFMPLSGIVEATVSTFASANVDCNQDTTEALSYTVTIREIANLANTVTGAGSICANSSAIAG